MPERLDSLIVSIEADTTKLRAGLSDATRLGRGFGTAITSAFEDAAINGRKLGDVVRGLALDLSRSALRDALDPLRSAFSGVADSAGASVSTGLSGLFRNILPFAKGGIIGSPAVFPLGDGRMGLAGEAGSEAILPLARGPDGRLGVRAGEGGRAVTINFNVTANDADSFRRSRSQIAAMISRAAERGTRNL